VEVVILEKLFSVDAGVKHWLEIMTILCWYSNRLQQLFIRSSASKMLWFRILSCRSSRVYRPWRVYICVATVLSGAASRRPGICRQWRGNSPVYYKPAWRATQRATVSSSAVTNITESQYRRNCISVYWQYGPSVGHI